MCVIIHQPQGNRSVTYNEFQNSWDSNPDGFGMLYFDTETNSVVSYKHMNMANAWREYEEVSGNYLDTDIILHFRFATHGTTNMDNCHPFPCGNGKYLVHNGVLGYESDDKNKLDFSDTRLLAETLSKYQGEWLDDPIMVHMVNSICSWDKIIVMGNDGVVHYFGQDGIMSPDNQLWASNSAPFPYHKHKSVFSEPLDEIAEEERWAKSYCKDCDIPYIQSEWF